MQHLHTVKIVGSNPTRSTTFILLPVELALGLRNRVAKVRFLPRVPLYGIVVKWYHTRLLICAMGVRVSPVPPNYDSQVIEFFKSGDIYINNGYLNKVLLLTVVNYHNYHPFYGVCSIMVVPKVVNLESAGSTPVIHPKHRKIVQKRLT